MARYGVFDIMGPIMIGPSSSHTAGAARLAKMAKNLTGDSKIKKVEFYLYGSFKYTYQGHGTDKALVGGILGYNPDNELIINSLETAKEQGLEYSFIGSDLDVSHPNTVRFCIETENGKKYDIMGSSVGGGKVEINEVDGITMNFTGENPIIITEHNDKPGVIANLTTLLYENCINIVNMRVSRHNNKDKAVMYLEVEGDIPSALTEDIKLIENIDKCFLLQIR